MNSNQIYVVCNNIGREVINFAGDCRNKTKSQQDPKCVEIDRENKKRKHDNELESNEFSKLRKS